MAEITDNGYQLQTQNEWFLDEQARYLAIDANWNLDPSVPDGIKLATDSEIWGNLDELGQTAYNARDLDRVQGEGLDILAKLFAIDRNLATKATAIVSVNGVNGTIIPAGSIVISSFDSSRWLTDAEITIVPGPGLNVGVTAETAGLLTASASTLTVIGTPIAGWTDVTNTLAATSGTDEENDAVFRRRIKRSRALLGDNQVDSMFAAIGNVDGVTTLEIYENDTAATDSDGVDPHSIAIFVNGGLDAEIGAEIAAYKNPGTGLNRTNVVIGTPVIVNTQTPAGRTFSAVLFRPTLVNIFIEVDVTQEGDLPSDIVDQVKEAIIEYTEPSLFEGDDVEGFNKTGFGIGEEVPPGRFYTPVNKTLGLYGASFATEIRVGLSFAAANTTVEPIAFNELSAYELANIDVTIT